MVVDNLGLSALFCVDQSLHLRHHLLHTGVVLIFLHLEVHEGVLAIAIKRVTLPKLGLGHDCALTQADCAIRDRLAQVKITVAHGRAVCHVLRLRGS